MSEEFVCGYCGMDLESPGEFHDIGSCAKYLRETRVKMRNEINTLQSRIAELEGELAELKERFDITDGLLNQATVSIGAVIACCTYNSNAEAMAGAYGISYRAFTMIDNFIKNYNRAVLDGKASTDVKNIICWHPNPPEVQE